MVAATAAAKAQAVANASVKMNGDPMPAILPSSVTLSEPYGFYDDDGVMNMWQVGQVVTDPDEILILIERSAPAA